MIRIKKSLLLALCSILLVTSVFAHGKGDIEDILVDNVNSWQEGFDLDSRKPGKYNIMITARDLGGNIQIEGPHNLYYDPKSDLPVCGITNPYPNMRVVGNLNIVGTCVDDDGVSRVELILDEGTDIEKMVVAEGKEFWSYYLDTNDLEEGPHTIKVIGYDINEEPVVGEPTVMTWQLDRKQPVTKVKDKEMGLLVSGNVKFDGVVSDGNGIKELFYSVDNGQYFNPVKISPNKTRDICNFTVNVDKRKFDDGPAVLWFKAIDMSGSVGMYSFLYFIDNTKPDVQIIYPAEGEVVNGKFTVAGFAKDTIGVTELSWTCGAESGDFELVPGNPYWAVTLDTIGFKEKSVKFTIHAVDRANNVVDVTHTIPLNQELDKPIVSITEPVEGQIFGDDDAIFVRGIATDDDQVSSVRIQFDSEEPITQDTKGVYYYELCKVKDISSGNHKVTVTPIDVNGVEGNPVVTNFVSKGLAPSFSDAKVAVGKEKLDFTQGMEIHPENNGVFSVVANSGIGLTKVTTKLTWGSDGVSENSVDLKNVNSYTVSLPITAESPKGLMQFIVKATDSIERESIYRAVYYVTNTSIVKVEEPRIVFEDSTVSEDGSIINNPDFPATGYVIGANAVSVSLEPETPFAKAFLYGNQIKLVPDALAIGSSKDVVVVVKTDKNKTIKSNPIRFKADTALPVIRLNDEIPNQAVIERNGMTTISGKITCETGVGTVKYRVISVNTDIQKGVIAASKVGQIPERMNDVNVSSDGSFSFEIDMDVLTAGMHIVEIIAESAGGNSTAKAVALSNIPEIEEVNGKMSTPKAPVVVWVDAFDVYGLGVYQGELDQNFVTFPRSEMNEGSNALSMSVTNEAGKVTSGKTNAIRNPSLSANIAYVNDQEYLSGMPVVLNYNSKDTATIKVFIDTGAAVNSVSYEFFGDEVPGGTLNAKGSAKLTKPTADEPMRWIAEFPATNLPSRVNNFNVTVKAGSLEQTIKGCITVVRSNDEANIDDQEIIYQIPDANTDYVDGNYILSNGSQYYYYANYNTPLTVELVSATPGLAVSTNGKLITLYAESDNVYKNVTIKVTDRFGDVHTSKPVNFIAANVMPEVHIVEPTLQQWIGNNLRLTGTATQPLGIKSVEYSLDNGETWTAFDLSKNTNKIGVTFQADVALTDIEDGLIKVDYRATDIAGHTSYVTTAAYKDVTPPEVTVIEPLDTDVVNGDNLIVFQAKDNAYVNKAQYVAPLEKGKPATKVDIELNPLIYTHIGTPEKPIDEAMSFEFYDEAGNKTVVEQWLFSIDNESDLPRAEIHVPDEMQVITRDFTISGVVYDDDGESSIYYKIDDGEYKQVAVGEVYKSSGPESEYKLNTSFSIDVPLDTMTDNEHTVTVYAVDINGVKGLETSRTFRISLEEPKGAVELPTIDTSVREIVTISGWASDKNGISNVQISLDNGNSYNDAVGTTEWKYDVDTRAIPGGTQVVFLKVTDGYGIQGLYSSLINIDNDAPILNLELPKDDSTTTGNLFFSGFTYDNVEVTDLYLTIRNLGKPGKDDVRPITIARIIGQTVDITDLPDGFYNIELTGTDKAGNRTNVSRNIHLDKSRPPATVDVLYPLNGEHKQGNFTIYGQAASEGEIESLVLYLDDLYVTETTLSDSGFFKFDMGPESMSDGVHKYRVDSKLTNGKVVPSHEQTITYSAVGPWVTIDNFTYGDFATGRPYIRGTAGYSLDQDEVLLSKTKEVSAEFKAAVAAKKVEKVELSFDNGKTFTTLSENEKWMYRIENQDIHEGYHFFLIRATMKNGETAITRTIIQIDNTKPTISLIAPEVGGRYNQMLNVSGLSNDDVRLEDVTVTLRKGDKSSYEVPSFIQGLYVDCKLWGASLFSVGAGLTFFDDVVKLQFSFGQFTQQQRDSVSQLFGIDTTDQRYGGNILSGKILANIAEIPFSFFFGHDYDWLYAEVALGCDFSYFTETNSGRPQILSAVIGQLEFPKVKLTNVKAFSSFSLYTEGSLWFIPTDVSSEVKIKNLIPQIGIGVRTNIF